MSPLEFSEMTIQPAQHECYACCPLQAEEQGFQPAVGNTHGTRVELAAYHHFRKSSVARNSLGICYKI